MSTPLFSVVIPTRDRPDLLLEAVASVVAQDLSDWECIVVDDGSRPAVGQLSDSRVRVVRHGTSRGVAAARNTGLAHASGTYVTFLDDDDRWLPARLRLAVRGLARAPVAVCARIGSDGTTGGNRVLEGDVADTILDGLTPQLGQVALRREVCPQFDQSFRGSQDVDWWLRLATSHPVATEPEVGLWYRMHLGVRNGNGPDARVAGGLLLLERHASYFRTHRRARAFRWKRIAIMATRTGERSLACKALLRSAAARPEPSLAAHALRLALRRA